MRAHIVVVKSDTSEAVGFPDFLEDNWHTNDCTNGTIATCPDLAHLETPVQLTAVYFRAYTRKSTINNLSRCHRHVSKHRDRIFGAFLSTNRHKPFLSD